MQVKRDRDARLVTPGEQELEGVPRVEWDGGLRRPIAKRTEHFHGSDSILWAYQDVVVVKLPGAEGQPETAQQRRPLEDDVRQLRAVQLSDYRQQLLLEQEVCRGLERSAVFCLHEITHPAQRTMEQRAAPTAWLAGEPTEAAGNQGMVQLPRYRGMR